MDYDDILAEQQLELEEELLRGVHNPTDPLDISTEKMVTVGAKCDTANNNAMHPVGDTLAPFATCNIPNSIPFDDDGVARNLSFIDMSQKQQEERLNLNGAVAAAGPTATSQFDHDLLFGGALLGGGNETSGILDLPPMEADSVFIQGSNGVNRWVTMKPLQAIEGDDDDQENLLDKTDDNALADINDANTERHRKIFASSGINLDRLRAEIQDKVLEEERAQLAKEEKRQKMGLNQAAEADAREQEELKRRQQNASLSGLWANRYMPVAFRDLLSDETINLDLLKWLKSWDSYIFSKKPATSNKGKGNAGPETAAAAVTAAMLAGTNTDDPTGKQQPSDGRPEERIVLVVGPPGVGKTTLAHVAARHCGYDPVEVNASMDRTVSAFDDMLTSVLQSGLGRHNANNASEAGGTHINKTKVSNEQLDDGLNNNQTNAASKAMLMKPKCLIIDEMDGVVSSVIPQLLKKDIHRPVICLANNLYAPALRELRQHVSTVLQVPQVQPRLLLSRLEVIVAKEAVFVDRPTLAELVHVSDGDIRTCLNTLQFLCRQASSSSEVSQLLQTIKGKDATLGLWSLWTDLFQRKEKAKYMTLLEKKGGAGAMPTVGTNFNQLGGVVDVQQQQEQHLAHKKSNFDPGYLYFTKIVQGCADPDTFINGAYQYYAQQRFADYNLEKTTLCADSFALHDIMQKHAFTNQSFGLLSDYSLIQTGGQCFVSCGSLNRLSKLQYPREAANNKAATQENLGTIRSFTSSCAPKIAAYLPDAGEITQEFAPFLLSSMHPSFKIPLNFTNSSLWDADKDEFDQLVNRHCDYNITYRKSDVFDFTTKQREEKWVLEPPLDRLIKYDNIRAVNKARADAMAAKYEQRNKQYQQQQGGRGGAGGGGGGFRGGRQMTMATPSSAAAAASGTAAGVSLTGAVKAWQYVGVSHRSDVRQVMTGEITRMRIRRRAEAESAAADAMANKAKKKEGDQGKDDKKNEAAGGAGAEKAVEAAGAAGAKTVTTPGGDKKDLPFNPKKLMEEVSAPKPKRDMFGRIIVQKATKKNVAGTSAAAEEAKAKTAQKRVVKYTFFDGSSSAVRRPAKLSDFFGN